MADFTRNIHTLQLERVRMLSSIVLSTNLNVVSDTMPVPWEALIPFGMLTVMFGAAGTLLNTSKRLQNDGKTPRYNVDNWDEMMIERDKRLTGSRRGQSSDPKAPEGFSTSSIWYLDRR